MLGLYSVIHFSAPPISSKLQFWRNFLTLLISRADFAWLRFGLDRFLGRFGVNLA